MSQRLIASLGIALLLGLLQGFTEFLPISSSGHLVLAQNLVPGFSQPGVLFDVVLHIGTLVAVCIYFRKDLLGLARSLVSRRNSDSAPDKRMLLLLVAGTIPTALIGFLFRERFEMMFMDVRGAAVWLIITGILLFITDRVPDRGRGLSAMTVLDALVIGVAQGLSIIPALSRSASTIAAGIFLGLERGLLVRYSFLLSIPSVAGAFLLELMVHRNEALSDVDLLAYGVGTLAAALVGYWSIAVLLKMTRAHRLSLFAYYCWIVGGLSLLLLSLR
jgi:undecaprenyl-diphosphatase